jgi:hypothetical protein
MFDYGFWILDVEFWMFKTGRKRRDGGIIDDG